MSSKNARNLCGIPVNLQAPALGRTSSSILLTWDKSEHDSNIDSYDIYMDNKLVGNTVKLSFTVRELQAGKKYTFSVRARDKEGNCSQFSNPVEVYTKPKGNVFNVKNYGAVGDGVARDTKAIQDAIEACDNGGTVYIPEGIYYINNIRLKSNMRLFIEKNAVLSFVRRNDNEYYPLINTKLWGPEGEINYSGQGLITGVDIDNITIQGEGIINGNGEYWWPSTIGYRIERPYTLELIRCSNILVQDITIIDPPYWAIHPLYCENAVFNCVKIFKLSKKPANNGDGINPDSSRHVLIIGCTFSNHDDSIAIKSGKRSEENGFRPQRPCEYIIVRDCLFDKSLGASEAVGGVAIGSEMSGSIRHVVIRDCIMKNAKRIGNIKTMRGRGGIVEDILFKDIKYCNETENSKHLNNPASSICINMFYWEPVSPKPEPVSYRTPIIRNIKYESIELTTKNDVPILINGLPEMPAKDISFKNVIIRSGEYIKIKNVEGLVVENIDFSDYFQ